MKQEKKKKENKSQETIYSKNDYDIDIQACSTTDCTGLIPAAPESEAELEAYEDLYPYLPRAKAVKDS
ncbi:MAG: hypothetical protein QM657_05220 [Lacrimispora sp.]|uniref:hypothetical protein n=1 Tax=Lacrimispora sp. TaxID=2719234 RepID=UPI0039E658D3